ncbi:MAG: DUF2007 domain-containing protein, partial [Pseudomonadota bacterium]
MKRVYTAMHLPDAHLLRDLLQQAGIPAHVFNENAASAIGLVPVSTALPEVWISQVHQRCDDTSLTADRHDTDMDFSLRPSLRLIPFHTLGNCTLATIVPVVSGISMSAKNRLVTDVIRRTMRPGFLVSIPRQAPRTRTEVIW